MIHTPFRVGRGVLAEPGNGHDELSISRTIMSSVIRSPRLPTWNRSPAHTNGAGNVRGVLLASGHPGRSGAQLRMMLFPRLPHAPGQA